MKRVKKKICFLQYDLVGGGDEHKVCTLADYFVYRIYAEQVNKDGLLKEYRSRVPKKELGCRTAVASFW